MKEHLVKYTMPVVAGVISGSLLIGLMEELVHLMYPTDPGLSREEMIKQMPMSALVLIIGVYIICSFGAGIVASLIAKKTTAVPAIIVGVVLTLGGMYNAIHLHHPLWFIIINLFIYIPLAWLGYYSVRKRPADGAQAAI